MWSTDQPDLTGRPLVVAVSILLAVAFIPRFFIADRALVFDERFTLMNTESIEAAIEHCREDVHPPLYFTLVAAWRMVFPSTELSLRLLSMIFGMLSVMGIFLTARAIAGAATGLAAMLIVALFPYHWIYSTELRPYAMFLAFSAFSTWGFVSLMREGRTRHFAVLAIATALNLYTHYFAIFLLASQAIVFLMRAAWMSAKWRWTTSFRNRQILLGVLTLALIAAAYAPWVRNLHTIITRTVVEGHVVGLGKRVGEGITSDLVWKTFYRSLGWGVIPFVSQVALLVWGLTVRRARDALFLGVAVWALPFLLLAVWRPTHFIAPKYFLFTYPLTVALVACGTKAAARFAGSRVLRPGIAVVLLTILVAASPLLPGQHPPYIYHRQDWKDIVEDLRGYLKPGDRMCFPRDSKSLAMVWEYAPEGFFRDHDLIAWREQDEERRFMPFESGSDIWLLKTNELPEVLAAGLGEGLEAVRSWHIYTAKVTLYHWSPGSAPIGLTDDEALGSPRPVPPRPGFRKPIEVVPDPGDILIGSPFLGRPTDRSITVSVIAVQNVDAYVEYGRSPGDYADATSPLKGLGADEPLEIVLDGLEPDAQYWYRLRYRTEGGEAFSAGPEGSFQTQRARGKSFVFTIQADSHIIPVAARGDAAGMDLYRLTLANVIDDDPDFHIDMGDFAHTEFYGGRSARSADQAVKHYLFHRSLLGPVARSIPFYLVIGNHEGEQGWRRTAGWDSLEIWSMLARKKVIPNPYPDRFYTGSREMTPCCGLREDYYAWEWGDALFVVLDPFWHTMRKPHLGGGSYPCSGDGWDWTLGKDQYDWLYKTLTESRAKWKLVLSHHMTGGRLVTKLGPSVYGRGGIDAASFSVAGLRTFEWGGEDSTGRYVFDEKRPGWDHGPVHRILAEAGVDIYFRGHDHSFVLEELDGVVYQTCPQPADAAYKQRVSHDTFSTGIIRNNSGHLRITVWPDSLRVDYVRSVLPYDEPLEEDGELIRNRTLSYSYTLSK
jgi:hypothetical protein